MTDIVERLRAGNVTVVSKGVHVVDGAVLREAADEIERLQKVCLIAEDVVWYDWSGNDSDAVHTMEQLRLALSFPPSMRNADENTGGGQ